MQRLQWLSLIEVLATLFAVAVAVNPDECSYDVRRNKSVDIIQSRKSGASAFATSVLSTSKHDCAVQCCANHTVCTVAEFNENITESNCRLIHCDPVESCIFSNSTGVHSIVVNYDHNTNNTRDDIFTKFAEERGTPTKEASIHNEALLPSTYNDLDADKSKFAKGRKSADPTIQEDFVNQDSIALTTDKVETGNDYHGGSNSPLGENVNPESGTVGSEVQLATTVLKYNSSDDKRSTVASSINDEISTLEATQLGYASTELVSNMATIKPVTVLLSSVQSPINNMNMPLKNESIEDASAVKPVVVPKNTTQTYQLDLSAMNSNNVLLASTTVNISSYMQYQKDLEAQNAIYLIISLVFGLVILLIVIGITFRRILNVWERRHYQRMDYLIDGMYNTA